MLKNRKALVLMAFLPLSLPASADSVTNVQVTSVGIQGTQIYVWFSKPLPGCPASILYHPVNQTGEFVMSLALSARMSHATIGRVDFHYDTNNKNCWIDLLEL